MVWSQTEWSIRARTGLARPDYLSRLRASQLGNRSAENGTRAALLFHLASICDRSENGLLQRAFNSRRVSIAENRNRHSAYSHRIRLRQNSQQSSSRGIPHE